MILCAYFFSNILCVCACVCTFVCAYACMLTFVCTYARMLTFVSVCVCVLLHLGTAVQFHCILNSDNKNKEIDKFFSRFFFSGFSFFLQTNCIIIFYLFSYSPTSWSSSPHIFRVIFFLFLSFLLSFFLSLYFFHLFCLYSSHILKVLTAILFSISSL